jgi:hypothetical protein
MVEDAGATVPTVAPKQFGAFTAGCMGTRYCIPEKHAISACNVIGRKPGHDEGTTVADTKGGADFNKNWYLQGNPAP